MLIRTTLNCMVNLPRHCTGTCRIERRHAANLTIWHVGLVKPKHKTHEKTCQAAISWPEIDSEASIFHYMPECEWRYNNYAHVLAVYWNVQIQSRWEDPPYTPVGRGGSRRPMLRGFMLRMTNKKVPQSWQTSALAMHLPLAHLVSTPVIFCLLPSSSIVILAFYLFSTDQWTARVRTMSVNTVHWFDASFSGNANKYPHNA